jgi:cell division protein ZipA
MRSAGLRHGQFGIFHAHSTDEPDGVLFSIANLVEPGTFDLAALSRSRLPGVSLFMLLPGPGSASDTLDAMLATARKLATALDGELLDEHGSSLSVQRERYIRDEIQQFIRQNLAATAGPGRSG